jgi:hypothetical protein
MIYRPVQPSKNTPTAPARSGATRRQDEEDEEDEEDEDDDTDDTAESDVDTDMLHGIRTCPSNDDAAVDDKADCVSPSSQSISG